MSASGGANRVHIVERADYEERNSKYISLAPVDLGFDLRLHGHVLQLPPDVEAVRFVGRGGEVCFARGTVEELALVLRDAGYTVEVMP